MATYEVSPDSLRDLAARLERIRADLFATGEVIGGYAGRLGAVEVDHELDDFFSNWSDGMHKIEGHLDGVVTRLQNAADAYEGTDQSIAKATTPQNATA